MRVTTTYSNFTRGQADTDLDGRFDLPIYNTALESCENFITNFKGSAIFRSGFEHLIEFQDCALIEFKFSDNQNYILVLYANKMRFLTYDGSGNFGWVLNPSPTIYEIDTPWSLAEAKEISRTQSYSQNYDVMEICSPGKLPYVLTRTAADTFDLRFSVRRWDPFDKGRGSLQAVTGATNAAQCQITCVSHGRSVGERVTLFSMGGIDLTRWTVPIVEVVDADNFKIDIDTSDTEIWGTFTSTGNENLRLVTSIDAPTRCLYYKNRLYYAATSDYPTRVFASEAGDYQNFEFAPATIVATTALQFTIAEMTGEILWLYPGSNSLIVGSSNLIVAVNGGNVGDPIEAESLNISKTSADGTLDVSPLEKDGFIFYIRRDARKMLFFSYDLLSERFESKDANIIHYDITAGLLSKIRHIRNKYDLVFAISGDGALLSCLFNNDESIIGWHKHIIAEDGLVENIAEITDNDGNQQLFALINYGGTYNIQRQATYKEFPKRKDFYTNDKTADDYAHYRLLAENMKESYFLDNFQTYSDLRSSTITYDSGAGTVTDGGSGFVSGDVGKHIVYKTATGYESGRFLITAYTSASVVSVSVLQEPTANSYSSWYLTFDSISGLTRFASEEVSVVADGGYAGEFSVSAGGVLDLDLDYRVSHVIIGKKYRGFMQSFVLGFPFQGKNTQATKKALSRFTMRFHDTVGAKVGDSQYRLNPMQDRSGLDLNYLPTKPMTGSYSKQFPDGYKEDKRFVIVQDIPGNMLVSSVMLEANYTVE